MLDVISKGHKLPSIRVPDPCFIRNKQSSVPALLRKLFQRLFVADCIEEHFELPNCMNPLSVAECK